MALTGMQIYKLLPKTNCKKCNMATCLAFAMKLANQKAEISECPDASEECVQALGKSSEPPIRNIELKDINRKIGGETVLYRHDKKFFNPTIIAMKLSDELSRTEIAAKAKKDWTAERVGQVMEPEAFYLENRSRDKEKFLSLARTVAENRPGKLMIFQSDNPENLKEVSSACASLGITSPVFAFADRDNYSELSEIAMASNGSIVLNGESINEIGEIAGKLGEQKFKNVILSINAVDGNVKSDYINNTAVRRLALKKEIRELGFPIINFTTDINSEDDAYNAAFDATALLCKYASIIVLDDPDKVPVSLMTGLMILRQNIYTDPQKPIQMESKLYEIGEVGRESPLYVTTNFSLTYFLVAGEIEAANHPGYLAVIDTEGMGVLTAWAAGKLNGDVIKKFIKDNEIEEKLSSKRIILPGYVAALSGEAEEALPDWDIIIGPPEAQDIPAFVKTRLQ